MSFTDWVMDSFASDEIIDLHFILSDLVDTHLTETEICERAYCDALATATVDAYQGEQDIPIGKLVL